jgi:surfactin synthase thioesterase subunit
LRHLSIWQDHHVGQEDLVGWREQTSGSFALHMFPGDHFFLHSARQPLLQVIGERLMNENTLDRDENAASGCQCKN